MVAILLSFIIGMMGGQVSTGQKTHPATISFDPPILVETRDSTGFVNRMINFYSNTGDTIRITRIEGSCRCGSATVQQPVAHDSIPGKFYVMINANHITDPVVFVDYTITTDPPGPEQHFRVVINIPPAR
ncbi:MAG: hypothetical protein HYX66_04700 [Ignavibacteria bacterium]|nr:hypothetical protein [Ignavibacteria bacterium]